MCSYCTNELFYSVPAVAPTINSTVRLNATTILVTWQPLSQRESRGVISFYHITYRGVQSNCSESGSTLSTVYIATHMDGLYVQLLVHHLVPRLSYCFQVAAATSAGVGPSSEPIVVGCELVLLRVCACVCVCMCVCVHANSHKFYLFFTQCTQMTFFKFIFLGFCTVNSGW